MKMRDLNKLIKQEVNKIKLNENKEKIQEIDPPIENKKRYVVTFSMYIYAKDDISAKSKSEKFANAINKKYDNQTSIDSIYEQPFGKLTSKKVFGE